MKINLATPALLFPAISLLLLAYTNRFLAIGALIRNLHDDYTKNHEHIVIQQIISLQTRLNMIKNMQIFGILSLIISVVSMSFFYLNWISLGEILFGLALIALIISLSLCFTEVIMSTKALNLRLKNLCDTVKNHDR